LHDLPEKITIDKSGSNTAAIESVKADTCDEIQLRQSKYLNNIVEQDHKAIKRITRPMLGFKSFWSARDHHRGHRNTAHDPQGADGLYLAMPSGMAA
jgi:transposase-like protein